MKTNLDDPKLTAYALGELEGEERAVVEALLVNSPEPRQWVEAVRHTAQRLETKLQGIVSGAHHGTDRGD